jgi:hypothetical protein
MKVWHGKKFTKEGNVYKQFITVTQEEFNTLQKRMNDFTSIDHMSVVYAQKPLIAEGKYIPLNLTQASICGVGNHMNTCLYLK